MVQLLGGGDMMIPCMYWTSDSVGKYYRGNFSEEWYLIGSGENFPFDYYVMVFNMTVFMDANFTLTENLAIFQGPKTRSLMDIWSTANSTNVLITAIVSGSQPTMEVLLERKSAVPLVEFVFPVILSYFFLGGSLFMNPRTRRQEVLTVYFSLFVFVPTFFFAIQQFLPYRSLFTIPEVLLVNLITSLGVLGFFAMVSNYKYAVTIRSKNIPFEWFGLIIVMVSFIIYYVYFFWPVLFRFGSWWAVITFLVAILGYCSGAVGLGLRLRKDKHRKAGNDEARSLYCR
jgi:hypothetical protein